MVNPSRIVLLHATTEAMDPTSRALHQAQAASAIPVLSASESAVQAIRAPLGERIFA